jgi:hypothetical protein
MAKQIVANCIRTPDGTILCSRHVHDYATYVDKNGYTYMVDGGRDYLRRNIVDQAPAEELSVTVNDPHELIRERFDWGTRGKDGKSPLTFKLLKDLDNDHIMAILETQTQIADWTRKLFVDELSYRNIQYVGVRKSNVKENA